MKSDKKEKRQVDIVVISDIHLGTYGCRAKELLNYLKSISPSKVILNGDIIDIWQFRKSYWPKSHMKVVSHLFKWMSKGVEMHYITGNHDEMFRKFDGFQIGEFSIANKLILDLNGEKAWVFHGDIFDITMQHSKWLTKLGAIGYDMLILINQVINFISEKLLNKGRISLSKKVKNSVKSAVNFINQFERIATDIAAENGYKYVLCGHIHHPEIKQVTTPFGEITYLNSGDWVENLTSLEYNDGKWSIYKYEDAEFADADAQAADAEATDDNFQPSSSAKELFGKMLQEMMIVPAKS